MFTGGNCNCFYLVGFEIIAFEGSSKGLFLWASVVFLLSDPEKLPSVTVSVLAYDDFVVRAISCLDPGLWYDGI